MGPRCLLQLEWFQPVFLPVLLVPFGTLTPCILSCLNVSHRPQSPLLEVCFHSLVFTAAFGFAMCNLFLIPSLFLGHCSFYLLKPRCEILLTSHPLVCPCSLLPPGTCGVFITEGYCSCLLILSSVPLSWLSFHWVFSWSWMSLH